MVGRHGLRHRRHVPRPRPLERAAARCGAGLAQEQHAGRAVHHLRHRADHPRMQRGGAAGAGQRVDAAQPFAAIVVALGEERIDQGGADMRSAGARGQQHRHRDHAGADQPHLGHRPPARAEGAEHLAHAGQRQQQHAAGHQAGAVEGGGARQRQRRRLLHAHGGQRQQRRHQHVGQRPPVGQHRRDLAEQRRVGAQHDMSYTASAPRPMQTRLTFQCASSGALRSRFSSSSTSQMASTSRAATPAEASEAAPTAAASPTSMAPPTISATSAPMTMKRGPARPGPSRRDRARSGGTGAG